MFNLHLKVKLLGGPEGCGECGTDTTAAPFCEEENVKQD